MDEIKTKLKTRLTGLSKVRNIVSSICFRKKVAEGIFTSVLVYCIPLWGGCDKGDIRDLQVLQNIAAQHVLRLPRRSSRNIMFDELGWLSVQQLVFYHSVMAVYKIRQTGEPEYLAEKLLNDNLRGMLIVPNTSLTLAQSSFCFRAGEYWRSLPESTRNLKKIGTFKKALKIYTLSQIPRFLD